jgi:hypothetical protein
VATPQSLRRIARLAQKLESDLRTGGMAYPWKSLFRTNAMLTRIVAHLADHLASEAEGSARQARRALPRRTRTTVPVEDEE